VGREGNAKRGKRGKSALEEFLIKEDGLKDVQRNKNRKGNTSAAREKKKKRKKRNRHVGRGPGKKKTVFGMHLLKNGAGSSLINHASLRMN